VLIILGEELLGVLHLGHLQALIMLVPLFIPLSKIVLDDHGALLVKLATGLLLHKLVVVSLEIVLIFLEVLLVVVVWLVVRRWVIGLVLIRLVLAISIFDFYPHVGAVIREVRCLGMFFF